MRFNCTRFINLFFHFSRIGWSYLTEVLDLLEPYSEYLDFFEIKAEVGLRNLPKVIHCIIKLSFISVMVSKIQ